MGLRSSHISRTSQDQSETHMLKFVLSASGKGRIEDRKTRTLEHHKGAPPVSSQPLKIWAARQPPHLLLTSDFL